MQYDLEKLVESMKQAEFYPHPADDVIHIETHISHVFLAGDMAYKIKKPVNLGFLDFTTLDRRLYYCREEVRLNRRLTDHVYYGVDEIKRDRNGYHLNEDGETVEYAVKMKRLPEEAVLKTILSEQRLDNRFLRQLSETLAAFYQDADTGGEIGSFGSLGVIRQNSRENFKQLDEYAGVLIDRDLYSIVQKASEAFIKRNEKLFERRVRDGMIRDCHGDLRAGRVYHFKGVQILDCIEFNHRFRFQDVASDLAFLIMDLEFLGFPHVALDLVRLYVRRAKDRDLIVLIDFYKCYRAMVRLKVTCFQISEMDGGHPEKRQLIESTGRYMNLAYHYAVKMARPVIWAVCGMIASGKSTVAAELADIFAIKQVRSDIVRKSMFDIPAGETAEGGYQQGLYSPEVSRLAYGKMLGEAQAETGNGYSVILDATYSSGRFRRDVLAFAENAGAYVIFVECLCTEDTIKARLEQREGESCVSDARLKHYRDMKQAFEPMDEIPPENHISVHTDIPLDKTLDIILTHEHDLLSRQAAKLDEIDRHDRAWF